MRKPHRSSENKYLFIQHISVDFAVSITSILYYNRNDNLLKIIAIKENGSEKVPIFAVDFAVSIAVDISLATA